MKCSPVPSFTRNVYNNSSFNSPEHFSPLPSYIMGLEEELLIASFFCTLRKPFQPRHRNQTILKTNAEGDQCHRWDIAKHLPRTAGPPEDPVPSQCNPALFGLWGANPSLVSQALAWQKKGRQWRCGWGLAGAVHAPRVGGWGAQKIEEELGYYIFPLILYQSSSLLPPSPERRSKE